MKIHLNLEKNEQDERFNKALKKFAHEYFVILEWLIILSLLYYWYAITRVWYVLAVVLLSSGVLGSYVSTFFISYFSKEQKMIRKSIKWWFFCLLTILLLLCVFFLVSMVAGGLVETY